VAEVVGGHLAKIESSEENAWLGALAGATFRRSGSENDRLLWIGANDVAVEGEWRWRDGEAVYGGFAAWRKDQPNNCGESDDVEGCLDQDWGYLPFDRGDVRGPHLKLMNALLLSSRHLVAPET